MRAYGSGRCDDLATFRELFEAAKADVLGSGLRTAIYDNGNPFAEGAPRCLAVYDALLRAPERGYYGVRFKASGYACLLLDGQPLLEQRRALGSFTAEHAVFLEQGLHQLQLCVLSRHPTNYYVLLEWQPPNAAAYTSVPPEALPSDVGLTPIARQRVGQPMNAFFGARVFGQSSLVRTDIVLSSVRFENLSASSLGEIKSCRWDFGDGATSDAHDPDHTYRGAGTYTVTLTARDTLGFEASFSRSLTVGTDVRGRMELIFSEQEERKIVLGDYNSGGDATVAVCVGFKLLADINADLVVEQRLEWRGYEVTILHETLDELMQVGDEQVQLAGLMDAAAGLGHGPPAEPGRPPSSDSASVRPPADGAGRMPSGPSTGGGRRVATGGRQSSEDTTTGDSVPSEASQAVTIVEKLAEDASGLSRSERISRLKEAAARLKAAVPHLGDPMSPEAAEALNRLDALLVRIEDAITGQQTAMLQLPGLDPLQAAIRVVKTASSRLERELVFEVTLPNLPGRFVVESTVRYGEAVLARQVMRVVLDTDPFPELAAYDPNLVDTDGANVIVKATGRKRLAREPLAQVLGDSPGALRVALIDNSLCPGGPGADEATLYYGLLEKKLAAAFPSRTIVVKRFATERDTLGHFPVKRLLEAGAAIEAFQPHAVVVTLDQADLLARTPAETVTTYLEIMVNHFAAHTRAKMAVVTPPPRPFAADSSKVFAVALGRFALAHNVDLADLYEAVNLSGGDWKALYVDDAVEGEDNVYMMYMNAAGQRLAVDTILKALLRE
ncbi:MAG: PKD domain-containing protein [Verrucomicrobia bacterium]|nr:PKD domain-containing protein [Verrucomicrobiota bacterium]